MKAHQERPVIFQKDGARGELCGSAFGNEYVILTLEAGASIDKHSLPIPVSFFVLSGSGTCTLNNKQIPVVRETLLHANPGDLREWKNTRPETLSVLVIKHVNSKNTQQINS